MATLAVEFPALSTIVLMVKCPVHEVHKMCSHHGTIDFIFAENVHLLWCKKILEPGAPSKIHRLKKKVSNCDIQMERD